jgi:hypothetical protein
MLITIDKQDFKRNKSYAKIYEFTYVSSFISESNQENYEEWRTY